MEITAVGRRFGLPVCAALCIALAAGCATQPLHDTIATRPAQAPAAKQDLAPIAFTRLGANIPRGRTVGVFTYVPLACGYHPDPEVKWSTARFIEQDIEYSDAFFRVLDGAGFNVIGKPSALFASVDSQRYADFQIGARIRDVRMNLCAEHNLGGLTGRASGEASMIIDWQVFSNLDRRVVLTQQIASRAKLETPQRNDWATLLLLRTFEDSATRLAASPAFVKLLVEKEPSPSQANRETLAPLTISPVRLSAEPITQRMERVLDATVTVLAGEGHGSGFVISRDGHVLTSEHVTDGARKVKVRFRSGLELEADVLRRDPIRDISLIRIGATGLRPLPIRHGPATVGEEVYALGRPHDLALQSSVTKGIVSALRRFKGEDLLIQTDVDMHSDASGGPLLDGHGNVVGLGISVGGLGRDGRSASTNFFIPVADALEKLNIRLGSASARN